MLLDGYAVLAAGLLAFLMACLWLIIWSALVRLMK